MTLQNPISFIFCGYKLLFYQPFKTKVNAPINWTTNEKKPRYKLSSILNVLSS